MTNLKLAILIIAILGNGALFGFYFTMSVSIMPGLDLTEPYVAIAANQDIGRATQQSLWFVALLGAPLATLIAVVLYWKSTKVRNWLLLSFAGWLAMMLVTVTVNVPLNQILDGLTITADQPDLEDLWASYIVDWQKWNLMRVAASGFSLFAASVAMRHVPTAV
ncbi:anthrone oxygenase family protein [Cognatiyoonia sp. IB215446]|uniref:anthrone oxygenase family protein n=1 Tax=Cognatiyoonia sp. IB215446 TaxID=3097355 RepID=UPI002A128870|nr:anthrone oxygenase family protein [Cognatiyoonia sp. IB215446]MDX8350036.1 anthrone oxygenase family protein [Cognatiyoonia sp. IB215446]